MIPCKSDQVRNPLTNRCKKITKKKVIHKPCRDPMTNRCKNLTKKKVIHKPCKSNQIRNPMTNRCKRIPRTPSITAPPPRNPMIPMIPSILTPPPPRNPMIPRIPSIPSITAPPPPSICKNDESLWKSPIVGEPSTNNTIIMEMENIYLTDMKLYDVKGDHDCFYHSVSSGILGSASTWKDISNRTTDLCKLLTDYYIKYKIEKGDSAKLNHLFFRWIIEQEINKTELHDVIFTQFYDQERNDFRVSYDDLSETDKKEVKKKYIKRVQTSCKRDSWGGFLETIILYRALDGLVTPTICIKNKTGEKTYNTKSYGSFDFSSFSLNESISYLFLYHNNDKQHYMLFEKEGKSIVKSDALGNTEFMRNIF